MTRPRRVGLLGGTFDPIHNGHLAAARAAQQALNLDTVLFLPAGRPPHRPDAPRSSAADRLAMVRLAVADTPGWEASDQEIRRGGPSFTFDTLAALHEEGLSPSQLFFITGADAFAEIATWHRYPDVLDGAHFVVVTRPGTSLDALSERVPALAGRMTRPAGDAALATPRVILVEADTPNVSSTGIRRLVMAGEPIDGMVPAAVAAYIAQHSLYRQTPAAADAGHGPEAGSAGTPPGK